MTALTEQRCPQSPDPLISIVPGEFSIIEKGDSLQDQCAYISKDNKVVLNSTPRKLISKDAELTLVATPRANIVEIQVRCPTKEKHAEESWVLYDERRCYLLDLNLQLGHDVVDQRTIYTWKDPENEGIWFNFVCDDTVNGDEMDAFDEIACRSIYMQTHDKLPPPNEQASAFAGLIPDYSDQRPLFMKLDPKLGGFNAYLQDVSHACKELCLVM